MDNARKRAGNVINASPFEADAQKQHHSTKAVTFMHELIEIAVSKVRSSEELKLMDEIARLAANLAAFELTFEERINANKALRGEKPTPLQRKKKRELTEYDKDAEELTSQLAQEFASMENAHDIIQALCAGLNTDIRFWEQAHKYTHPADLPIVSEYLSAKTRLRDAMSVYLKWKVAREG
jgi:hypothetical protein